MVESLLVHQVVGVIIAASLATLIERLLVEQIRGRLVSLATLRLHRHLLQKDLNVFRLDEVVGYRWSLPEHAEGVLAVFGEERPIVARFLTERVLLVVLLWSAL